MATKTMDALMMEAVGIPIIPRKRKVPVPKDNEMLVKVAVVGLNPYDFRARDWGLFTEGRLPLVLGNDITGTVVSLGPAVPAGAFAPGDRVFGQTNFLKGTADHCGLQEYALLHADAAAKVPTGLSDDDGASLPCNLIAAFWALFGAEGLRLPFPWPGAPAPALDYAAQTLAVLGAGSNCGKYAVQAARLAGFGRIVAVAGPGGFEELRGYGATHVVDRHAADVAAQVRAITGDDLIYALDAFNLDHTLGVSLLSSSRRGTLATLVPGKPDESEIGEKRAGYEDRFSSGKSHAQPELAAKFWKCLPGWMAADTIRATGWEVLEGLDAGKVNAVLDSYRDNKWPPKQVHVHL